MARPTVLLADDHRIVAEGLRSLLETEYDLVAVVGDGRAMLAEAERLRPDVIVADISMPLLNGLDAVEQIRKAGLGAKIVFLTMHADVTYATRAFDVGASGFVLKHSAPTELTTAIREALAGRTYVTPRIAKDLLDAYRSGDSRTNDPLRELSPRQREVLQLLAEGKSAKGIADLLHISPRTVEFHKYRIMRELGIKTSAGLVRYAVKHGLVELK